MSGIGLGNRALISKSVPNVKSITPHHGSPSRKPTHSSVPHDALHLAPVEVTIHNKIGAATNSYQTRTMEMTLNGDLTVEEFMATLISSLPELPTTALFIANGHVFDDIDGKWK
jgi:hypothetical protein